MRAADLVIAMIAAGLTLAVMVDQGRVVEPVLQAAPVCPLPALAGYTREALGVSDAEKGILPADTQIEKYCYADPEGVTYLVSRVIGGREKGSIHRPEMCLPAQGFQMSDPRELSVGGTAWHAVTLARQTASSMRFAYAFANQDGFRTSSHVRRIFRDVWDRSIRGRIDRWVMTTVLSSAADDGSLVGFISALQEAER